MYNLILIYKETDFIFFFLFFCIQVYMKMFLRLEVEVWNVGLSVCCFAGRRCRQLLQMHVMSFA